jgi:hypothetical protein
LRDWAKLLNLAGDVEVVVNGERLRVEGGILLNWLEYP